MNAGFCVFGSKLLKFLYAIRADILSAQADKILCAFAENAGRLILAENNIVSFNIYL